MSRIVITRRIRGPWYGYTQSNWPYGRPLTPARLLREAGLTEEEIAEKEHKRKVIIARIMSRQRREFEAIKNDL